MEAAEEVEPVSAADDATMADVSDLPPAAAQAEEAFTMPDAPVVSEEVKAEQRARLAAMALAEAEAHAAADSEAKATAAKEEQASSIEIVKAAITKGSVKAVTSADFDVLAQAAYQ